MLYHLATVRRPSRTLINARETVGALATVYSSMPCLAEGLNSWRQASVFGEIGAFTLTFTWGEEVLYDDDEITLSHKPGVTYYLKRTTDDTHRPAGMTTIPAYQTGVLSQEPVARS